MKTFTTVERPDTTILNHGGVARSPEMQAIFATAENGGAVRFEANGITPAVALNRKRVSVYHALYRRGMNTTHRVVARVDSTGFVIWIASR